jgi:hypothetical protein
VEALDARATGVAHPAHPKAPVKPPLPLLSFDRIVAEPLPPAEWLVEPLIGDGSRVVVYGEWGSFKSWALLSLGLHIAAGQPWLGQYPVHGSRRVLYIDEEMSPRLLRRRVKRLAAGMDPSPERLPFRALSRRGLRLDAHGVTALLADLKASGFDPDVIVVETFRRVLVGNENDAREVADFWRAVDPIIRAGKSLIVSHHMKKPQAGGKGSTRHRASGSTDVMGAADDALAFERAGKEGFTVEPVKCREAEEAAPFAVSLVEPQGPDGPVLLRHEGSPADFKGQAGKVAQAESLILAALREAPNETLGTASILATLRAKGVKEKTAWRALANLKARGSVLNPEKGVWQLPGEHLPSAIPYKEGLTAEGSGFLAAASTSPSDTQPSAAKPSAMVGGGGGSPRDPYDMFRGCPIQPIPPGME